MAEFRSANVLGTWYGPNNMLKQEMPTTVLGDDGFGTPIAITTPVSDGGVMCVGTADLAKAARRNWKHASVGATVMGAVIELAFDIRMHPIDEFVPSISSYTFHLGTTTVTTGGGGTGLDFTGGDPHRVLDTYTADPIVVGTCLQSNDGENSAQNVYYVPTLQMEWHGLRWWDQSVDGGDSVIGGFSMMLTGEIRYEDGYHVANDGVGLDLTTPTWISNWKVYQVAELADWGLNDTPLGGPDLSLYNTYVGAATCYFAFGSEGPTDPIPLAGLHYISSDPPVSEVLITSMEVRFPTVVGAMTPL